MMSDLLKRLLALAQPITKLLSLGPGLAASPNLQQAKMTINETQNCLEAKFQL
jgi:hypothetical protein